LPNNPSPLLASPSVANPVLLKMLENDGGSRMRKNYLPSSAVPIITLAAPEDTVLVKSAMCRAHTAGYASIRTSSYPFSPLFVAASCLGSTINEETVLKGESQFRTFL